MSEVTVEFGAKDTGLDSTIKKVNSSLDSVEKNTKKASESVNTSFASMVKAGAALAAGFGAIKLAANLVTGTFATFKEALDLGGQLADMSARTGIAVKDLAVLGRAFENAGKSAADVGVVVNKMQKSIAEAGDGAAKPAAAFDALGISITELRAKAPAEQFEIIGKAIAGLEDPTMRTKIAMDLFGRSGGEMLAFFGNGKDGIEQARKELGSFAGILAINAAQMDVISDQFKAIKNKGIEFATGLLSEVLPAIELVTTALSQIDAAAIGVKLGEIITGGSAAMKGFSDALSAFKLGEFRLAFDIAFASIKLQIADTANSIYIHFSAAVSAAAEFIKSVFGPGSSIELIVSETFDLIANKAATSILKAMIEVGKSTWLISDSAVNKMETSLFTFERKAVNSASIISGAMGGIADDAIYGTQMANKTYQEGIIWGTKLVDTSQLRLDLDEKSLKLTELQSAAEKKVVKEKEVGAVVDERMLSDREHGLERLKDLESEIAEAKSSGNKEELAHLEAELAFQKEFERYAKNGRSHKEAMEAANNAFNKSLDESLKKEKEQTGELKKQLTLMDEIAGKLKAAREPEGGKRFQKIKAKFEEELEGGKLGGAKGEHRIKQMKDALDEDEIRKGRPDRRMQSLTNMAKAAGIDTFGMDKDEIRNALLKQTREALKPENKGMNKEEVKAEAEAKRAAKEDPAITLSKLVEKIHVLVAKIEPKLPQHALN